MESKKCIRCSYLICASDVIARTKSADCVRVYIPSDLDVADEGLCTNNKVSASTCSSDALCKNDNAATPIMHADDLQVSPTLTTCSPKMNRVQRRKEKKRRKKEHRNQMKEEIQPLSIRVTTTAKFNSIPKSNCTKSIVHVKPLVVLDLNGILCHRVRTKNTNKQSIFRPSVGNISHTEIIPRSDLHEFLTLLHTKFCLAVWTSATRKTARVLVRMLFPDEVRERLIFVWHRNFCNLVDTSDNLDNTASSTDSKEECFELVTQKDRIELTPKRKKRRRDKSRIDKLCTIDGDDEGEIVHTSNTATKCNSNKESPNKTIDHRDLTAIKSLSKVWDTYPLWDATNTILLDDSPEKCPTEYRGNALHPPPICGTITACSDKTSGEKSEDEATKDAYSIKDDDEVNQNTQRNFFTLLAQHWSEPTSPPGNSLMTFLKEHANSHNMGWEMSTLDNAAT